MAVWRVSRHTCPRDAKLGCAFPDVHRPYDRGKLVRGGLVGGCILRDVGDVPPRPPIALRATGRKFEASLGVRKLGKNKPNVIHTIGGVIAAD